MNDLSPFHAKGPKETVGEAKQQTSDCGLCGGRSVEWASTDLIGDLSQ
jgi:hypothetical protein